MTCSPSRSSLLHFNLHISNIHFANYSSIHSRLFSTWERCKMEISDEWIDLKSRVKGNEDESDDMSLLSYFSQQPAINNKIINFPLKLVSCRQLPIDKIACTVSVLSRNDSMTRLFVSHNANSIRLSCGHARRVFLSYFYLKKLNDCGRGEKTFIFIALYVTSSIRALPSSLNMALGFFLKRFHSRGTCMSLLLACVIHIGGRESETLNWTCN